MKKEIVIHKELRHDFIVSFCQNRMMEKIPLVFLEACRTDLHKVLEVRKRLTQEEVQYYMRQLLAALEYIHEQGYVHRDIKIANMMIDQHMNLKLGDFGLACKEKNEIQMQTFVGTPNYIAPEVIRTQTERHCYTKAVDYFSCGIVMYVLLDGKLPFKGSNMDDVFDAIMYGSYTPSRGCGPSAHEVMRSLLHKDPNERGNATNVLAMDFFTVYTPIAFVPEESLETAPTRFTYTDSYPILFSPLRSRAVHRKV